MQPDPLDHGAQATGTASPSKASKASVLRGQQVPWSTVPAEGGERDPPPHSPRHYAQTRQRAHPHSLACRGRLPLAQLEAPPPTGGMRSPERPFTWRTFTRHHGTRGAGLSQVTLLRPQSTGDCADLGPKQVSTAGSRVRLSCSQGLRRPAVRFPWPATLGRPEQPCVAALPKGCQ